MAKVKEPKKVKVKKAEQDEDLDKVIPEVDDEDDKPVDEEPEQEGVKTQPCSSNEQLVIINGKTYIEVSLPDGTKHLK